ncbi:hypothetical protein PPTG_21771 [Phytophthora nicotianae INRA-310]|uniref:Uncharacterized protein n=1 Tax=Phytophthora nicotianae (strain INRA-310) TaxID=761204 RepID=W2QWU3_PHYN3|nr:hypothetical protein PPTG_21771 [Phytophthora nicotianae INRA-310]ETN16740.1 hypothetical protein PPTG_21771 [Phytophthora nicotianae INRA-310]
MQALAISTKVDQVCPGKLDKNLNKQGLKNNVVIAINPKLWKSRGFCLEAMVGSIGQSFMLSTLLGEVGWPM